MAIGMRALVAVSLLASACSAADGELGGVAPAPSDSGDRDVGLVTDAPAPDALAPEAPDAADAADAHDAPTWTPDPVPAIDPEPAAPCADVGKDAWSYQFLDDVCDAKVHPTDLDPDFACPIVATSAPGFRTSSEPVVVEDVLSDLVPPQLRVTVIVIRRVDGVPRYRYLSNGTSSDVFQPWSSSKFLAIANAGATLRKRSDYAVGLGASVDGREVGDLITAVHDYSGKPWSSNSISRWFHDVGGRANANAMIHEAWLGRPSGETFGGNYGEAAPPLGLTFVEPTGASVTITRDTSSGPANALSTRTLAEALKRLALHREDAATRLPGIQWADLRVLFHGAPPKDGPLGGMSADTAIYLQAGHDADYVAKRSKGRFRNYSKLGFGSGQLVHVGYSCWPVLDPSGAPAKDAGDEFVIAARLASGGADMGERDRILARAYRAIIRALVARKL